MTETEEEGSEQHDLTSCLHVCDQSKSAAAALDHLERWLLASTQSTAGQYLHDQLNDGRLLSLLWHHLTSNQKTIIAQARLCLELTLDLLERTASEQPSTSVAAANLKQTSRSKEKKDGRRKPPVPEPSFLSTISRWTFDQVGRKSSLLTLEVLQSRYGLDYLLDRRSDLFDVIFRSSLQSVEINKRAKLALKVLEHQGKQLGVLGNKAGTVNKKRRRDWLDLWIPSICSEMLVDGDKKLHGLTSYYLPQLLELAPWSLVRLANLLCESGSAMTLLAVLRSAKELDLCRIAQECRNEDDVLLGSTDSLSALLTTKVVVIPPSILASFLASSSAQAQAAALSILIESKSPTSPLSDEEIRLVQLHITSNFSQLNPDLRQTTLVKLNKFLLRLRALSHAAHHILAKAKEKPEVATLLAAQSVNPSIITKAESFALWLFQKACRATYPGSPFHMTRSGISMLEMLLDSGLDPRYTFSDKRKGKTRVNQPLGHSWPFAITLVSPMLVNRLLECHGSTYLEIQERSRSMLLCFPSPLPAQDERQLSEQILSHSKALMLSPREFESEAGASLSSLFQEVYVRRLDWTWPPFSNRQDQKYTNRQLLFISDHLCFLGSLLDTAQRETRLAAARKAPLHGTFVTLQRLFSAIDVKEASAAELRKLKEEAIALVDRAWDVTRAILCNSAPEGSTSQTSDHETARALEELGLDDVHEDEDTAESFGSTPKYQLLLTYAWRGMKEASAFLGVVVSKTLSAGPAKSQEIWTKEEMQDVGSRFNAWLSLIRHRGAFSTIYPAYSTASAAIVRSGWAEVEQYPLAWLSSFLDTVASPEASISTTRRSAGIGYAVLALLCSLPDECRLTLLNETLIRLVETVETSTSPPCRIHALNILRVIVADANLAGLLEAKIGSLFILIIPLFTSDSWHIRNASMMLFSELAIRAFGKSINREESGVKYKYDWYDFFARFPGLDSVLYKRLQEHSVRTRADDVHQSSVFAVLLILSKLQVFVDEEEQLKPKSLSAASDFAAVIEQCLHSSVWKLREIAATALAAATSPSRSLEVCRKLLARCIDGEANATHGRLLAVQRVLDNIADQVSDAHLQDVRSLLATLHSICSRPGQSRAAQVVCLETALSMSKAFPLIQIDEQYNYCLRLVQSDEASTPISTALQVQLRATSSNLILACNPSSTIGMAIQHPNKAVRQEAVRFILNASDKETFQPEYASILKILTDKKEQATTRIDAARILDEMPCPLRGEHLLQGCLLLSSLSLTSSGIFYRDQCLPCLSRMLTALHREADVAPDVLSEMLQACLNAVSSASKPEESVESRLAAIRAATALQDLLFPARPNTVDSAPATAGPLFLGRLAVLALAQDDDEEVRDEAAILLKTLPRQDQHRLSESNTALDKIGKEADSLPRSSSASVDIFWNWMGEFCLETHSPLWQEWVWSTLIPGAESSSQSHTGPHKQDTALFAEEKANQYFDQLDEWQRCFEFCRDEKAAAKLIKSETELDSLLRGQVVEAEDALKLQQDQHWDGTGVGSSALSSAVVRLQRLSWGIQVLLEHPSVSSLEDCRRKEAATTWMELRRILAHVPALE